MEGIPVVHGLGQSGDAIGETAVTMLSLALAVVLLTMTVTFAEALTWKNSFRIYCQ